MAVVLNHRIYKETDLIITLLTSNRGKIIVSARGVKSASSHRQGNLEIGNIIKTQLYEKSDRFWLTDTTVIKHSLGTTKSLVQLNLLFYFLEIINHFIAENQQIDGTYEILVSLLDSVDNNNFSRLISSEINLLEILGFGVPENIIKSHQLNKLQQCQKEIKEFLESIIEKPLKSSHLFH
jgi:DNA repair protein RecO